MAQIKPGGKILIGLFAVIFMTIGIYQMSPDFQKMIDPVLFPTKKAPGNIDAGELARIKNGTADINTTTQSPSAQQKPPAGVTTVDNYKYVGRQAVRQVEKVSTYTFDNNTVVFPINIWGGWAPIVMANNGFEPSENSVFFKKFGFKVQLKLIDDPDAARGAYASGHSHVLWGTLDMIALFAEGLSRDSMLVPKVPMQIDWSNGGDGIVARAHVQSINDLRGKTVVLAQNSPSHYYILSAITEAGIQPSEINWKFTDTAFGAARAFLETASIDACATWAPDIYKITDAGGVKGAHLLTTTGDAKQLIADVFAVRADFMRDHRDIVKGLVEGIFIGMEMTTKDPKKAAELLGDGFGFDASECSAMMGDAHTTNFAENMKFFTDKDFGANFERTWKSASYVYRAYGAIGTAVSASKVKDSSILEELKKEGKFASHKDLYIQASDFAKKPGMNFKNLEANPILTKPIIIQFAPNSYELDDNYDTNIPRLIEDIGKLAEKFGGARIVIEGNVDTSKKLDFQRQGAGIYQQISRDVQQLSQFRAKAVKDKVLEKFKNIPRDRISVIGNGWDSPSSLTDHKLNRRVEVKVFRLEAD
jgi:NitT/TauT family transport system substrate-binding protein